MYEQNGFGGTIHKKGFLTATALLHHSKYFAVPYQIDSIKTM